ncbi:MAG TPA: hypothetical protein VLI90_18350, partial [Tepidisphaeraceae bacterium]|nr:hypothetical protein [Tepidisphaeraceae bacterium]
VVAIVQGMVEQQKVSGLCGTQRQLAAFVLQGPPAVEATASVDTAPLLRDNGRPQSERPNVPKEQATPTPAAAEQRPAQVGSAELEASNGK